MSNLPQSLKNDIRDHTKSSERRQFNIETSHSPNFCNYEKPENVNKNRPTTDNNMRPRNTPALKVYNKFVPKFDNYRGQAI